MSQAGCNRFSMLKGSYNGSDNTSTLMDWSARSRTEARSAYMIVSDLENGEGRSALAVRKSIQYARQDGGRRGMQLMIQLERTLKTDRCDREGR